MMVQESRQIKYLLAIIVVGIGLSTGLLFGRLAGIAPFSKSKAIEYSYIYSTKNAGLENSGWKIVFYVINRGTESIELTGVFVDKEEVDIYGLVHGENLLTGSEIGTSLPEEGYTLEKGKGLEIYIWIGEELYMSGSDLSISLNPINAIEKYCSVTIY